MKKKIYGGLRNENEGFDTYIDNSGLEKTHIFVTYPVLWNTARKFSIALPSYPVENAFGTFINLTKKKREKKETNLADS